MNLIKHQFSLLCCVMRNNRSMPLIATILMAALNACSSEVADSNAMSLQLNLESMSNVTTRARARVGSRMFAIVSLNNQLVDFNKINVEPNSVETLQKKIELSPTQVNTIRIYWFEYYDHLNSDGTTTQFNLPLSVQVLPIGLGEIPVNGTITIAEKHSFEGALPINSEFQRILGQSFGNCRFISAIQAPGTANLCTYDADGDGESNFEDVTPWPVNVPPPLVAQRKLIHIESTCYIAYRSRFDENFLKQNSYSICLDSFSIDKALVTMQDYEIFSTYGKTDLEEFLADTPHGSGQQFVSGVSWYDAVEYSKWLSEQTGHNYRLPTEAELQYFLEWDERNQLVSDSGANPYPLLEWTCSDFGISDQVCSLEYDGIPNDSLSVDSLKSSVSLTARMGLEPSTADERISFRLVRD